MHIEYPARLYIVMARDAPRAVILRRGPSNWVRVILWHTDTDTFVGGQWLRGRIYGERCALSPDGTLFLYFAAQYHKLSSSYHGTWTALSKPPYLTALALWPLGSTWGGGGQFIDNRAIILHQGDTPHPDHVPPPALRVITREQDLKKRDQAILEQIEARDWQLVYRPPDRSAYVPFNFILEKPWLYHRAHPTDERYYLARREYGYLPDRSYPGPMVIDYALGDHVNNTETALAGANWADWDQRGRVAYARDGQVFAQPVPEVGQFARPLADFNDQTFESIVAPDWAMRW